MASTDDINHLRTLHERRSEVERLMREEESIRDQIAPLQRRLNGVLNRKRKATDALQAAEIASGAGDDWSFLLNARNDSKTVRELFDRRIAEMGLFSMGHWPDTMQREISLKMTWGDEEGLRKTIEAVRTLLPHLKANEHGWVRFGIFEHTAASTGGYSMRVRTDLSEISVVGSFSRKRFSSLEDAVAYVQREHWYDGREEPEDPFDDGPRY